MKAQLVLITTKSRQHALNHTAENLRLEVFDNERGILTKARHPRIQIDNRIDWKEQINMITANVSRAISILQYAKTSFLLLL